MPLIALITDPAASNTAFLLPGDITVSPSKNFSPLLGKDFLIKLIYSSVCVIFNISSGTSSGVFHIKSFLFF